MKKFIDEIFGQGMLNFVATMTENISSFAKGTRSKQFINQLSLRCLANLTAEAFAWPSQESSCSRLRR